MHRTRWFGFLLRKIFTLVTEKIISGVTPNRMRVEYIKFKRIGGEGMRGETEDVVILAKWHRSENNQLNALLLF